MRALFLVVTAFTWSSSAFAFNNADCPTYFSGAWTATLYDAKRHEVGSSDLTFSANGTMERKDSTTTESYVTRGTWSATPGDAADRCNLMITQKGVSAEVTHKVVVKDDYTIIIDNEQQPYVRYVAGQESH